jgi:hypothetical protein
MRKSKTKSKAMAKADRYFSEYIRLRDSNENCTATCITCGKEGQISEMDAGHFIDRSHKATRYDEQNVNAQCRACNRFQSGRQYEHGIAIDLKYGAGTANELLQKSRQIFRANQAFYESEAERFKQLAEEQRQHKRC